jgi:hypothetical protein
MQSARIAVTPSAQRPNDPARSPEISAAWVLVRYVPMVATISTGERRPPGAAWPGQLRRGTAGIRRMLALHQNFTQEKRR